MNGKNGKGTLTMAGILIAIVAAAVSWGMSYGGMNKRVEKGEEANGRSIKTREDVVKLQVDVGYVKRDVGHVKKKVDAIYKILMKRIP